MKEHFSDTEPVPTFEVSPQGAYVRSLVASDGTPILYPETEINDKWRGRTHACLPNFGPDKSGLLSQHGFARDVLWRVNALGGVVMADLYVEEGDYAGLQAQILYQLEESSFTTAMKLTNLGDSDMLVSPGFHPYFAVNPDDIKLDGKPVRLEDFADSPVYRGVEKMVLETDGKIITVASDTLRDMVVWSDQRGKYLCVEPTMYGPGFDSNDPMSARRLARGDMLEVGYTISWQTNL